MVIQCSIVYSTKILNAIECPPLRTKLNKRYYIHKVGYYTVVKKKKTYHYELISWFSVYIKWTEYKEVRLATFCVWKTGKKEKNVFIYVYLHLLIFSRKIQKRINQKLIQNNYLHGARWECDGRDREVSKTFQVHLWYGLDLCPCINLTLNCNP